MLLEFHEEMSGEVFCRGVEVVDFVEVGVVGKDFGQFLLDFGKVYGDSSLVQAVGFHLDLDGESVTMDFFTLTLVVLQKMGRLKFILDS